MLTPVVLALDHNTGGHVGQSNRRAGFVDVLAAGSRGAEHILTHIFFVDFHLDAVLDFGGNVDRCETGLSFAFRVVRTDSDEPMDPFFALEVSVGKGASDNDRGLRDPRPFVVGAIDNFGAIAVLLRPGSVHAE